MAQATEDAPDTDTAREPDPGFAKKHRWKIGILTALLFISNLPSAVINSTSMAGLAGRLIGGLVTAIVLSLIVVLVGVWVTAGIKRVVSRAVALVR